MATHRLSSYAYAPTAETFAAAVAMIEDDPVAAFAYASRRAWPEDLAALAERYRLSVEQTAAALSSALVPPHRRLDIVDICRGNEHVLNGIAAGPCGTEVEGTSGDCDMPSSAPWSDIDPDSALSL